MRWCDESGVLVARAGPRLALLGLPDAGPLVHARLSDMTRAWLRAED